MMMALTSDVQQLIMTMMTMIMMTMVISRQECKKSCPVVRMGKLCIEVTPSDK